MGVGRVLLGLILQSSAFTIWFLAECIYDILAVVAGSWVTLPISITVFFYPYVFFLWSDSCIDLPQIPFASWERRACNLRNQEVFEIGTVLKYQCKPGYRPTVDEPLTVTCQKNLTWTTSKGCESKWTLLCVCVCFFCCWKCWAWARALYLTEYNWSLKKYVLNTYRVSLLESLHISTELF